MDEEDKKQLEENIRGFHRLKVEFITDCLSMPVKVFQRMMNNCLDDLRDLRVENIEDRALFNYITQKMNEIKSIKDECVEHVIHNMSKEGEC